MAAAARSVARAGHLAGGCRYRRMVRGAADDARGSAPATGLRTGNPGNFHERLRRGPGIRHRRDLRTRVHAALAAVRGAVARPAFQPDVRQLPSYLARPGPQHAGGCESDSESPATGGHPIAMRPGNSRHVKKKGAWKAPCNM